MRNLMEYPILLEEVLECLEQFHRDVDPDKTGLCGDMRPLLLLRAIKIIKNAYGVYE